MFLYTHAHQTNRKAVGVNQLSYQFLKIRTCKFCLLFIYSKNINCKWNFIILATVCNSTEKPGASFIPTLMHLS